MAGTGTEHLRNDAVLRVEDLVVEFPVARRRTVHAVSGISLDVTKGETLGLVGESGCGKSTTGRAIVQLVKPASGSIVFQGQDLTKLDSRAMRRLRPGFQMVFQDPISSLNPRHRIGDIVEEPLRVWGRGDKADRRRKVAELVEAVGLDPETTVGRMPHQFSGGQCQRISIARALILDPEVLICDEPVSSLDVSVQAQILNLLEEMKVRYGLTMVFIAHDLAVVKSISDRIAVMYLGKLCEVAAPDRLFAGPAHHYTAALLAAIPRPGPQVVASAGARIDGELPSPQDPPSGCRFRTRCAMADDRCAAEEPLLRQVDTDHYVACHHPVPVSVNGS